MVFLLSVFSVLAETPKIFIDLIAADMVPCGGRTCIMCPRI